MSKILRHEPDLIGLTLREGGWVLVEDLLNGLQGLGLPTSRGELEAIVESNDKKRFTISEDGTSIRAAQGHSISVEMNYASVTPPTVLFHGTADSSLSKIFEEGLRSRSRQFVHLSSDLETAVKVGQRHGRPVVLELLTEPMIDAGHDFYRAENGVWLTHSVPAQFLKIHASSRPLS